MQLYGTESCHRCRGMSVDAAISTDTETRTWPHGLKTQSANKFIRVNWKSPLKRIAVRICIKVKEKKNKNVFLTGFKRPQEIGH